MRRSDAKGDDSGHVFGSRAAATLLTAADQQSLWLHARFQNQGAGTLSAAELMRRQAQQIDAEIAHRYDNPPGRLNRVAVDQARVLVHDPGCLSDRLNDARLVIGKHHGYQNGATNLSEPAIECCKIDQALPVHRYRCLGEA